MIFDRMAAAVASSIPFAVGTDGMHGELVREIEYLVDLGASNHVALKAATSYGAKVCGIESETGTLEPGKRADIIAVKGNPLDDVQVLRRPVAVVKQGEIIFAPDRQPTFTHQGHAL
jgi:imidazolonepropionase-like amidohydrolase